MSEPLFRPPPPGTQPDYKCAAYGSTAKRAPDMPLVRLPLTETERRGPLFPPSHYPLITDMSKTEGREALGERIIVSGTVRGEDGRPVAQTMIELWQANAAGRYHHDHDDHDAPLDSGFRGEGRVFTDDDGRYRFVTIKPGAYPWKNHKNAWRPNHIHFSLFGHAYASRLITQMYFPGDPLLDVDPIYQAIPDEAARRRLVAELDLELTQPEWALGYRFDIVLRGPGGTPFERHGEVA